MADAHTTDDTRSDPAQAATDGPAASDTRRAPTWRSLVLPWVVAVLALAVAGVSTWQWLVLAAADDTREQVQRAAETFVLELTNWDASEGLAGTREELQAAGTGEFLQEVDELFGGTLGAELEAVDAVSTGEVQDVFIQRIEGDQAIAFAVVLQQLSTSVSDQPERTVRSARMELTEVDGRWLVSSVQLLADGGVTPDEVPTPPGENGEASS
jgi:Mce-associated membrane protein